MDHKTFFSLCGPETEELYQAFKQRLIEDLRVNQKTLTNYGEGRGMVNEFVRLIDTAEQATGNGP